jgi:hypothetical protein
MIVFMSKYPLLPLSPPAAGLQEAVPGAVVASRSASEPAPPAHTSEVVRVDPGAPGADVLVLETASAGVAGDGELEALVASRARQAASSRAHKLEGNDEAGLSDAMGGSVRSCTRAR